MTVALDRRLAAHAMCGALALLAACELPHDTAAAPCSADTGCPTGQMCVEQQCAPAPASCAQAVSAGEAHTCAIRSDHTAWCWGRNEAGQLGDGTVEDRTSPVQVAGPTRFTAIATGFDHTCALAEDRSVWCWGSSADGKLGDTVDSLQPVRVSSVSNASSIAVGSDHSCALVGDGSVKCWGKNDAGQLGNGTGLGSHIPTTVPLPGAVQELIGGADTTCAIDAAGALLCWGSNYGFELGDDVSHRTPSTVAMPGRVVHAAIGADFLCALTVTDTAPGAVYCAGRNVNGQLGVAVDVIAPHPKPIHVPLPVPAASIAAGAHFACAVELRDDRHDRPRAWCWGHDSEGQLADGADTDRPTPTLADDPEVAAVAGGSLHMCALSSTGGIACSGYNSSGQLGNGERTTLVAPPQAIMGLAGVSSVATGEDHTCAVVDGDVECWGGNRAGQLGDGTLTARNRPVRPIGVRGASSVAVGRLHSCALLADQTAVCWGNNQAGQTGDAMREQPVALPAPVILEDGTALSGITQLAAGGDHTCAIAGTGAVLCWGDNRDREVGTDTSNCLFCGTPQPVALPPGVLELALGDNHSCALNADHTVMCWGASDEGERGDGTIDPTFIPTLVGSPTVLTDVEHIATYGDFTCAIVRGGTARCWGHGGIGEAGDGTYTNRRTPGDPVMLAGVTRLAAGGQHACALAAGRLACWGASFRGQAGPLGRGGYLYRSEPAVVRLDGAAATDLAAGGAHTCALLEDQTVTCWGDGRSGQLGNGMSDRRTAVAPRLPCP